MKSPRTHWTSWPTDILQMTLGTIIGKWRVIGSKPGQILLLLLTQE